MKLLYSLFSPMGLIEDPTNQTFLEVVSRNAYFAASFVHGLFDTIKPGL